MGLLDKLLHRPAAEVAATATQEAPSTTCPHVALLPRWDNVADIGFSDKATGYRCDTCGQEFSPAEAHSLRMSEGDRVRDLGATPSNN